MIIEESKNKIKSFDEKKIIFSMDFNPYFERKFKNAPSFMPFITEEIWQNAPWNKNGKILMVEEY